MCQMMVSSSTVFKWQCLFQQNKCLPFWPVGTNQQMLLRTFPQAHWHRTLPPVSFPSSQKLSLDSTGCLVETFCRSSCLVKRVQPLFAWPSHSSGLDTVWQVFLKTCVPPWALGCPLWSLSILNSSLYG